MATADTNQRPIIIKKVYKTAGGHHGGAWKVAYADFVTAMMAFFLLMWLLNATTEDQRKGIADYFDPNIPIARISGGGVSMFKGDSLHAQENQPRNARGGSGREAAAGDRTKEPNEMDNPVGPINDSSAKPPEEFKDIPETLTLEEGRQIAPAGNEQAALAEGGQVAALMQAIESQVEEEDPSGELLRQLKFKMTDQGLRIDIIDEDGVPLFDTASAKPTRRMKLLMEIVASVIVETRNDLVITGHTDAKPFRSGSSYSNWELSSERALAARRFLIASGLKAGRFDRVEGKADQDPLNVSNPFAVQNRRISITLMKQGS